MRHQKDKQSKATSSFSLPNQDDCKTRMDTKKCTTKHTQIRTTTECHSGNNNQQQNYHLRTDSSQSHGEGGLNAFYWFQIFALDSAVVEAQNNGLQCIIIEKQYYQINAL